MRPLRFTSNTVLISIFAVFLLTSPLVIFTSYGSSTANANPAKVRPAIDTYPTPGVQAYGHFGQSVATAPGNIMVVGAGNQTAGGYVGAGIVYTFITNKRLLKDTFISPNVQAYGDFGGSVAISAGGKIRHPTSSRVIVGAPNETVNGYVGAGRAYVYNTTTGVLSSTLASPNLQYAGEFGWSVTASGSLVVVGAPNETVNGYVGAGRAYVFNSTTGNLISTLASSRPQADGHFGYSVSMSDNSYGTPTMVAVGAPGESADAHGGAGQAYVFTTKTYRPITTLSSPSAQLDGGFGWSVSLTLDIVAVGAPGEASNGKSMAGNAYAFNARTGNLLYTLEDPNAESRGYFGWSVWLSEQTLVVGAPKETVKGYHGAGRAYTFNDETGSLIQIFNSPNKQSGGSFGFSVTVVQGPGYPGYIIGVGAPDESVAGYVASGRVYG